MVDVNDEATVMYYQQVPCPFEPLAPTWQNASNKMLKSASTISLEASSRRPSLDALPMATPEVTASGLGHPLLIISLNDAPPVRAPSILKSPPLPSPHWKSN
ncbi:hypothetical protein D5086_013968 [Populus alba]|uniref:Uncharacterized protein n=1 Tax=Populus alba TaxID=43335 RepID=A0ACC4C6V3_POPAL